MKVISLFIVTLLSLFSFATPSWSQEKTVAGWIETVRIYPGNILFHAKLDTGADHSSLNSFDIKIFTRNGETWVRFKVKDRYGKRKTLERKLHRSISIKGEGMATQKRPVVMLGICLGGHYKEVEVNLVDRGDYKYKMLIGRSFMADRFVVDPSAQYTLQPNCEDAPRF